MRKRMRLMALILCTALLCGMPVQSVMAADSGMTAEYADGAAAAVPAEADTAAATEMQPAEEQTIEPSAEQAAQPAAEQTVQPESEQTVQPAEEQNVEPAEEQSEQPAEGQAVQPPAEQTVQPSEEQTDSGQAEDPAENEDAGETDEAEEADEDEELQLAPPVTLEYQTHVQTYGWETEWKKAGETSGTEGQSKRLEGIRIRLAGAGEEDYIEYRTHVQTYGWETEWTRDGGMSGTEGESKRLEGIQIRLSPSLEEAYDLYYCVHAQTYGWLGWAKNGAAAGTEGQSKRLEGIRIVLVEKGAPAPAPVGTRTQPFVGTIFRYQTHVQTYGWQEWVTDGQLSGTWGLSRRLEGICIQINPDSMVSGIEGSVEYRTHVQTYGWETEWKRDGEMSGTQGESKRLEAIQIRLTGPIADNYDIYYRVHAQTYGWLGWAKNGESAGTEGLSRRLEAIQIIAVTKGGEAPGSTYTPFRKSLSSYTVPYAQPASGTRTIRNMLQTALVPCGRTLYSWGGGHGPDTNLTGMPQQWIDFFESHSSSTFEPSYDYIQYWNGVDCSGYTSWVIANTTGNYSGSAILAQSVAQVYAGNRWVTLIGTGNQTFLPGDFVSVLYGHIWISLGQCSDGSTLLIHSSDRGIQLSGTGGKSMELAAYYMQKYFPYWPYPVVDFSYLLDEASYTGRWITNGSGLLTDPDGMQKMSAEQVMKVLLGD